jgi:hypothetical protein
MSLVLVFSAFCFSHLFFSSFSHRTSPHILFSISVSFMFLCLSPSLHLTLPLLALLVIFPFLPLCVL